jgi:hypothetical protein
VLLNLPLSLCCVTVIYLASRLEVLEKIRDQDLWFLFETMSVLLHMTHIFIVLALIHDLIYSYDLHYLIMQTKFNHTKPMALGCH